MKSLTGFQVFSLIFCLDIIGISRRYYFAYIFTLTVKLMDIIELHI